MVPKVPMVRSARMIIAAGNPPPEEVPPKAGSPTVAIGVAGVKVGKRVGSTAENSAAKVGSIVG
jgi:hypothetical protein